MVAGVWWLACAPPEPHLPGGTSRLHSSVPALSLGSDPDGGEAFPGLSSVIKGDLIFTKQSPGERGGPQKPEGHSGCGPEAPLPDLSPEPHPGLRGLTLG